MSLDVSVVIATYRRPELLRRCLEALLSQDVGGHRFEILVVDDGRCERTRALIEDLARRAAGRPILRYLLPGFTRGPAAARNVGWRAARTPLIAFTDDDTIPAHDWLSRGMAALEDPSIGAAWGHVSVPVPSRPSDYERNIKGLDGAEFVTANCFVRRERLVVTGGFDERFLRAWREDSDLYFSLLEAGTRIVPAPAAIVLHPVRPAGWGVSLRTQSNVFFDALLYRKHPALYRTKIRARPPLLYYAIVATAMLALGFALAGWTVPTAIAGVAWFAQTTGFAILRLRHTRRDPRHLLEMLATSAVIPFLSVFWRLAGSLRFRTRFV